MKNKRSAGEIIVFWLAFCSVLLASACWSSGGNLTAPDWEQTDLIGSRSAEKLLNDPFQPASDFGKPASGLIGPSGASDTTTGDCDALERGGEKPRIALIIDDMGNHQHIGEQLLGLDMNLTFSFLPYAPFTPEQEEEAWSRGRDILVHMPMEPKNSQWDPGPDALYVDDSSEGLTAATEKNLMLVPHAIGVNNHMGSRFTEDRPAMHRFLGIIRRKGMFFIDSGTTAASTGMSEAIAMGIKTARRHVFLDNIQTQEDICLQLKELVKIARQKGWAIGIGHANDQTLTALVRCRDTLSEYVRVVGIHELIN